MAASVLQAGPMVQMIFARRGEGLPGEGSAINSGLAALNLSPQSELAETQLSVRKGVAGCEELATKLNSRTTLNEKFAFYPNLSNSGNYRFQFSTVAATKLKGWLSWQVSFLDGYLSNPLPGLKKNDLLLSTGIRLTFGKGAF
jgi:hypothetical protein